MVAFCSKISILTMLWWVTACAADIAKETDSPTPRLVRRVPRKRRNGVADTVVAQIQPQGDVLTPELVKLDGEGDLLGRAAAQAVSPSGHEESLGGGETQMPPTSRVSKSMSKESAWGSWAQVALAALQGKTNDDTAGDEALQNRLRSMKKSQLMALAREMGIAEEVIDDANDENYAQKALVQLLLNYKANHQKVNGKHSRPTRMVTHADGDTEKIGKPTEEDFAELDNVERPPVDPHAGKVIIEHKFRGCFPLADENELASNFHDLACMKTLEGEVPCRGGLPFFRLPMAAGQSYLDCFTFCLSKGLDLSGIVTLEKNKECRCGATVENAGAWHREQPKKQLLLPSKKLKSDDPNCRLLVWEYTGGLTEDDSVPYPLLQMSSEDRKYLENIATGHDVTEEHGAGDEIPMNITDINITIDDDSIQSLLKMSGVCRDDQTYNCGGKKGQCRSTSVGPAIRTKCPMTCGICLKNGSFPQLQSSSPFKRCYPHNCAGGGGPWRTKRSDGNAYINFFFQAGLDNARKNVFRRAVQEYHSKTCIRWIESAQTPRISVGIYDIKMCTASVGFPGSGGTHIINMGWCKGPGDLGAVIHEMGHSVGMNHEQNRIDGSARAVIDGTWRGPSIYMYWQNVAPNWRSQYVPLQDTYVGSAYDGQGDPHWGYQPYDFGSIMHYPRDSKPNYDTIPRGYNSVVGQLTKLSEGDIRQIKDMYQCGKPPETLPCQWWCVFSFGNCWWKHKCGGCKSCGGFKSLIAKEATQDSTVNNDGSSLLGASAKQSVNNEDPEDDIAIWVADAWGACKKGKVICARSRQVVCESPNGKEVEESKCDPSQKPSSKQACYCSERAEVPKACSFENPKFGNKSCNHWRHGVDCLTIDPELPASCPRTCGLC